MVELLSRPWPWYVAGPLIGLMVPLLLVVGGRMFGVSATLRTTCALLPVGKSGKNRFPWTPADRWRLVYAAGIILGGVLAGTVLANPEPLVVAAATRTDLAELGIGVSGGLLPTELFAWDVLGTVRGLLVLVAGGLLVGFGTAWAGGCTSGHAISGLSDLQLPSLIAVVGFFAGGLLATHLLFPLIF